MTTIEVLARHQSAAELVPLFQQATRDRVPEVRHAAAEALRFLKMR